MKLPKAVLVACAVAAVACGCAGDGAVTAASSAATSAESFAATTPPSPETSTAAKRGDTPGSVASTPPTPAPSVTATNETVATLAVATTSAPASAPPVPTSTPASAVGLQYIFPIPADERASYGREHSAYPATDIFARCGAAVVAPTSGTLTEVRRENRYDPATDNPALRGGKSVTLIGDDGVRYYFSHFSDVVAGLEPGMRVEPGDQLALVGNTGRSSACHLHFGISPPCPGKEWAVRRGAVAPAPFLDAWREGTPLSPAEDVAAWAAAHPDACADAMAQPTAGEA
jgi:peptidoglycan LD-endopeptidase LytH